MTKYIKFINLILILSILGGIFAPVFNQAKAASNLVISDIRVSLENKNAYIEWRTNKESNGLVKFDTDYGLKYSIAVGGSMGTEHRAVLINLKPQTKYYFQVVSADVDGNQTSSFVQNLQTGKYEYYESDFQITNRSILDVTNNSAAFYWHSTRDGYGWVEYMEKGATKSRKVKSRYGRVNDHQVYISGLNPNTEYFYRIVQSDKNGNEITTLWFDFKTRPEAFEARDFLVYDVKPVDGNDINVFTREAVITWRTNFVSGGTVWYKKEGEFRKKKVSESMPYNFNEHRIKLQNLEPGTKYIFYIESTKIDSYTKKYYTREYEFVTKSQVTIASVATSVDVSNPNNVPYTKPNTLYKVKETGEIYADFSGRVYKILSPNILIANNYVGVPEKVVNKSFVENKEKVKLIRVAGSPRVYYLYLSQGIKKAIQNPEVFDSYAANDWDDVIEVSQTDANNYRNAYVVKTASSNQVYKIENDNTKRPIESATAFVMSGFKWSDIITIGEFDLSNYKAGQVIK